MTLKQFKSLKVGDKIKRNPRFSYIEFEEKTGLEPKVTYIIQRKTINGYEIFYKSYYLMLVARISWHQYFIKVK